MLDGQALTIWTIRLSLAFFFVFAIVRISRKPNSDSGDLLFTTARWLWTAATALYLIHVMCAFHFIHHWSHAAAIEHTAETTERFVGLRFGGGIWFNHLFTAICISETIWMWLNPKTFAQRPAWFNWSVYGYFVFIAINAAVIFVAGPMRWIAASSFLALLFLFVRAFSTINKKIESNKSSTT